MRRWPTDPLREAKKLKEICDQVTSREVPMSQYLWIHRDAVLTAAERESLCQWTRDTAVTLALPPPPPSRKH